MRVSAQELAPVENDGEDVVVRLVDGLLEGLDNVEHQGFVSVFKAFTVCSGPVAPKHQVVVQHLFSARSGTLFLLFLLFGTSCGLFLCFFIIVLCLGVIVRGSALWNRLNVLLISENGECSGIHGGNRGGI